MTRDLWSLPLDFETLNPWGFKEHERGTAQLVNASLAELSSSVRKFLAALRLFQANRIEMKSKGPASLSFYWMFIGAEAAALAFWNFHEALQSLDALVGKSATLKEHLDRKRIKDGRRFISHLITDAKSIRYGITHAGRSMGSEKEWSKHTGGSGAFILNNLGGDVLHSTIDGKLAKIPITDDTLEALLNSFHDISAAFAPVAQFASRFTSASDR